MTSRKDQLVAMLRGAPDDLFLHFALAMEHAKLDETEQAIEQFEQVLRIDPAYVAAFAQKAALCERTGRVEQAKRTYREGIAAATTRGDRHSADRMQEALDRLVRATGP